MAILEAANLVELLKCKVGSGTIPRVFEVFVFTNNFLAEITMYKGSSSSKLLHNMILDLQKMAMNGNIIIHFVWISGHWMIWQGTDGLSRGDFTSSVMAGEAFLKFIPLHLSTFDQHPPLEGIIKEWTPNKREQSIWKFTSPDDWFHMGRARCAGCPTGNLVARYIQRATLDAFWSQEQSTVKKNTTSWIVPLIVKFMWEQSFHACQPGFHFHKRTVANSLWLNRFTTGCHRSMGDVWLPDARVTLEIMDAALDYMEEKWDDMEGFTCFKNQTSLQFLTHPLAPKTNKKGRNQNGEYHVRAFVDEQGMKLAWYSTSMGQSLTQACLLRTHTVSTDPSEEAQHLPLRMQGWTQTPSAQKIIEEPKQARMDPDQKTCFIATPPLLPLFPP
eukprot:jgi/Psemu1/16376/gm1.16376_g